MNFAIRIVSIMVVGLFSGCASAPPAQQLPKPPAVVQVQPLGPGVYHRVAKGQTLWRISKMYNVDIDDLKAINHISDVTSVEVGQLIFIPGGKSVVVRQRFEVTANEDFMWPLKGRLIASFGVMAGGMRNNGINIVPGSDKNVLASRSGRIVFYDADFYGWGKIVIIDHGDGYASVYGRNADVFVKVGDTVSKGMAIARVGTAGRDTHEYLHFEIRKGSVAQNPKFYLP